MIDTNITTTPYRLDTACRFIQDISAANSYYFFVGDHLPHANSTLQDLSDNVSDTVNDAYLNMICGKRVTSSDAALMINNVQWTGNTVYSMYDDQNQDLPSEQFFVIVDEGSFSHIWKCLDNNDGAISTIQPTFAHAVSTSYYQTADGYRWKYMTSVGSANVAKFETSLYFPVTANSSVAAAAVGGAIDIIKVEGQGARYNNYLDGTFSASDIGINGDAKLFNLSNTVAKSVNGFYTDCILYIVNGTGLGQFDTIVDYVSNTTGKVIQISAPFIVTPDSTSQFQIRPQVEVTTTGLPTSVNCVAMALVNTINGNSIYSTMVLQSGQGFFAASTNVLANSVVGVTSNAIVRPIMPPPGGHGANVFSELFSNTVELSVTLSNSESNTIPTTNMYQQIGFLKQPLFANVNLTLSLMTGSFQTGETIYSFLKKQIDANATVALSNTFVDCDSANFVNQFAANDFVLLSTAEGTIWQLAQVNAVANSSHMTLKSNAILACTSTILYSVNLTSNCICTAINAQNNIMVSNCSPILASGTNLIGATTGTTAAIQAVIRNGETKSFATFIELYKYSATLLSGSFTPNEVVTQGSVQGYIFDVVNTGGSNITVRVSNFNVSGFSNGNIMGNTSGAIANVTGSYQPEILFGSGKILYLENINAVNRQNNETFQITFNF